jgi:hypothetical protein
MQAYLTGMFATTEDPTNQINRAFTIYHLRLAESHPDDFAEALAPQVDLLLQIVEEGVAGSQFRRDMPPRQLAMILSQTLVSTLHMNVLGIHLTGVQVTAEQFWAFCLSALATPASDSSRHPDRASRSAKRR